MAPEPGPQAGRGCRRCGQARAREEKGPGVHPVAAAASDPPAPAELPTHGNTPQHDPGYHHHTMHAWVCSATASRAAAYACIRNSILCRRICMHPQQHLVPPQMHAWVRSATTPCAAIAMVFLCVSERGHLCRLAHTCLPTCPTPTPLAQTPAPPTLYRAYLHSAC